MVNGAAARFDKGECGGIGVGVDIGGRGGAAFDWRCVRDA